MTPIKSKTSSPCQPHAKLPSKHTSHTSVAAHSASSTRVPANLRCCTPERPALNLPGSHDRHRTSSRSAYTRTPAHVRSRGTNPGSHTQLVTSTAACDHEMFFLSGLGVYL